MLPGHVGLEDRFVDVGAVDEDVFPKPMEEIGDSWNPETFAFSYRVYALTTGSIRNARIGQGKCR